MHSLGYFLKEAVIGFKRNLGTSLGSVITIFLSLLIIGVFIICGLVINNIVESIESEVNITVYVADDAADADIKSLESDIKSISGVSTVSFTTKAQALENFKKSMSANPEIVEQLDGENPLPASIGVELVDPQQVSEIANTIAGNAMFLKICDSPDNPSESLKYGQKTVEKLFAFTNYIRYIGIALIVLLIFIALVFVNNTIRLAILARSREISIMRLVGASNGFIRGPFLTEGALDSVIGALLAAGVLELLRNLALPQIKVALAWLPIDLGAGTFFALYGILLLAGIALGLIGSALAMRKYLKV